MYPLSRLRALREDQALSIRALGVRSGVSPSTILRAEQGHPAYPATVRKLAHALGVSPAELRGPEPVAQGYAVGRGPGVGNPNLTPGRRPRRASTAERPADAGLAVPAAQLSYGALIVRVPGRRRAHFVPTISQVRAVLEGDGFSWPVTEPAWQATTTVCGRPEPWDDAWSPDAAFPAQLCSACQRGLEAAYDVAPVPLRPS